MLKPRVISVAAMGETQGGDRERRQHALHNRAPDTSDGGRSRGRVHQWTSAGNRPKNSHFFSFFGPPGVIATCRDSIRKPCHVKQIRPDLWHSRANETPCGTWTRKFSYRFSLIVQYPRPIEAIRR